MIGFRDQHRPDEAIFFGMEAVSSYQQIRKNISGMDKDLQAGFAQSKSKTYRVLAELLVEAGRLGEAEEILDLLKEQELKDIVRGAAPDSAAKVESLQLTAAQQKVQSELAALDKMALAFEQLNVESAGLQTKAARTPEEDNRLKTLNTSMERNRGSFKPSSPARSIQARAEIRRRSSKWTTGGETLCRVICRTRWQNWGRVPWASVF